MTTSWKEEGLKEEAALLVSRQLERRFGPLAPEMQARLNALEKEPLEILALELLDFTSIGQVQAWLDANA